MTEPNSTLQHRVKVLDEILNLLHTKNPNNVTGNSIEYYLKVRENLVAEQYRVWLTRKNSLDN